MKCVSKVRATILVPRIPPSFCRVYCWWGGLYQRLGYTPSQFSQLVNF